MNTSLQVMIECPETFTEVFQAGKKLIQSRSTNSKISVNGLNLEVQQQLLSFRQERDEERTWEGVGSVGSAFDRSWTCA